MIWALKILIQAEDDLKWFRNKDKILYIKCFDFIRAVSVNPRDGIGHPKQLKHYDEEVWSRKVSEKDRMVYTIYEKDKEINISSCRGHYDDK